MGKHVFIVAGDASGDVYGAQLISALKEMDPSIEFSGLGGDQMAQTDMRMLYNLVREFSVMGFIPVILGIPKVMRFLEIILDDFDLKKPDLVVLIDYPGFNLYLATHTFTRKIPTVYYVTPQIWAWAPWRIKKIKKYIHKMLVIFPFEVPFYEKANVPVEYVGHPLLDKIAAFRPASKLVELEGLSEGEQDQVLAILPGSRRREITLNLPAMLLCAQGLQKKNKVSKILLAMGSDKYLSLIESILLDFPDIEVEKVMKNTYNVLNKARMALVTSGTATLETAIFQTPLVIFYRLPKLHHWIFRRIPFLRCRFIALPNIIAGRLIVPEHIFAGENPPLDLMENAHEIWQEGERRTQCLIDLKELGAKVASPGASVNAAKAIKKFLPEKAK